MPSVILFRSRSTQLTQRAFDSSVIFLAVESRSEYAFHRWVSDIEAVALRPCNLFLDAIFFLLFFFFIFFFFLVLLFCPLVCDGDSRSLAILDTCVSRDPVSSG